MHGKTNRIVSGVSNQPIECQKKCVVCDMLKKGIHRCDDELSKQVDRKQRCDAWNVVYGINCTRCDKIVYVGETGRTLKDRLKEHEADVRLGREKPMAEHFNKNGHCVKDMGVCVLECIRDESKWYRKIKEQSWIERCGTECPLGLNTRTKIDSLWQF